MAWFRRQAKRQLGEHAVSGWPAGTEIIYNATQEELDSDFGFPDGSELLERHGKHFHLIEGSRRIAIDIGHFVERSEHGRAELVEDRTLYVLPEGTTVGEGRRIGFKLLQRPRPPGDRDGTAGQHNPRAIVCNLDRPEIRRLKRSMRNCPGRAIALSLYNEALSQVEALNAM